MSTARLLATLGDLWVDPCLERAGVANRVVVEREQRDVEARLGLAIYEVAHLRRSEEMPQSARMVRDEAFERALTACVPHEHVEMPAVVRARDPSKRGALVEWAGVAVWVPKERVVERGGTPVLLAPSAHPAISPGFVMVHGSRGGAHGQPRLRVYVHVRSADGMPAVWGVALRALERARVPYQAKSASVRWFYPRADALTIYLPPGSWHAATAVAAAVGGMPEVAPEASAFCRPLAPGVAIAWDPSDGRPGRAGLSFGEHRASVVAATAVARARDGRHWRSALPQAWREASVDPRALWRNAGSPALDLGSPDDGTTPVGTVVPEVPASGVPDALAEGPPAKPDTGREENQCTQVS